MFISVGNLFIFIWVDLAKKHFLMFISVGLAGNTHLISFITHVAVFISVGIERITR